AIPGNQKAARLRIASLLRRLYERKLRLRFLAPGPGNIAFAACFIVIIVRDQDAAVLELNGMTVADIRAWAVVAQNDFLGAVDLVAFRVKQTRPQSVWLEPIAVSEQHAAALQTKRMERARAVRLTLDRLAPGAAVV